MKILKFLSGFLIGFLLGTIISISYCAMSSSRTDREFDKFEQTSDGKTAMRIKLVE